MAGFLPLARNLRTDGAIGLRLLHLQNCLLPEENEQLPFAGHVIGSLKHVDLVENLITFVLMRAQKVVISDPERHVIVGTFVVVVTASDPIRSFKSAVETFNHLFIGTKFFGDCVIIGQTDYLSNIKVKIITEFTEELLSSQRIGTVTIGDKSELLR